MERDTIPAPEQLTVEDHRRHPPACGARAWWRFLESSSRSILLF